MTDPAAPTWWPILVINSFSGFMKLSLRKKYTRPQLKACEIESAVATSVQDGDNTVLVVVQGGLQTVPIKCFGCRNVLSKGDTKSCLLLRMDRFKTPMAISFHDGVAGHTCRAHAQRLVKSIFDNLKDTTPTANVTAAKMKLAFQNAVEDVHADADADADDYADADAGDDDDDVDTVKQAEPAALQCRAPDDALHCWTCTKNFERKKLFYCVGCHVATFCSEECYKKNWKAEHRRACPMLAQFAQFLTTGSASTLSREACVYRVMMLSTMTMYASHYAPSFRTAGKSDID